MNLSKQPRKQLPIFTAKDIINIIEEKQYTSQTFKYEEFKKYLLERLPKLKNIIQSQNNNLAQQKQQFDTVLEKLEYQTHQQYEFLNLDNQNYVYIVLEGQIAEWKKKKDEDIIEEIELQIKKSKVDEKLENAQTTLDTLYLKKQLNHYQKKLDKVYNQGEVLLQKRTFQFQKKIKKNDKYFQKNPQFSLQKITKSKDFKLENEIYNIRLQQQFGQGQFLGNLTDNIQLNQYHIPNPILQASTNLVLLKLNNQAFYQIFNSEMSRFEIIKSIFKFYFPSINHEHLLKLSQNATKELTTPNQIIYNQNDAANFIILTENGQFLLQASKFPSYYTQSNKKYLNLCVKQRQQLFGPEDMENDQKRICRLKSINPGTIYKIPQNILDEILQQSQISNKPFYKEFTQYAKQRKIDLENLVDSQFKQFSNSLLETIQKYSQNPQQEKELLGTHRKSQSLQNLESFVKKSGNSGNSHRQLNQIKQRKLSNFMDITIKNIQLETTPNPYQLQNKQSKIFQEENFKSNSDFKMNLNLNFLQDKENDPEDRVEKAFKKICFKEKINFRKMRHVGPLTQRGESNIKNRSVMKIDDSTNFSVNSSRYHNNNSHYQSVKISPRLGVSPLKKPKNSQIIFPNIKKNSYLQSQSQQKSVI